MSLKDFLETHKLLPEYKPATDIYIAVLSSTFFNAANELASELRESGKKVAVDWTERKLGDQIKSADKHHIPYLIVVGEDEAKSKTYKLKDLKTGEEKEGSVESLKLEWKKI